MNKTLLIIQREYLARVKKKSFVLMTFLVPGLILAMYGGIYLIAKNSDSLNKPKQIKVVDETGLFASKLQNHKNFLFSAAEKTLAEAKKSAKKTMTSLCFSSRKIIWLKTAFRFSLKRNPILPC